MKQNIEQIIQTIINKNVYSPPWKVLQRSDQKKRGWSGEIRNEITSIVHRIPWILIEMNLNIVFHWTFKTTQNLTHDNEQSEA